MTAYIISSLAWALLGLLVGYTLGRGARAAVAIEEAAAMPEPEPGPDPVRVTWWSRVRRAPRPTSDQILGLVVVVLAIASVVVMAVSLAGQQTQIDKTQESIKCQTRFNEAFAASLAERTDAATQERNAQRELLTAVIGPQASTDAAPAIKRYLGMLGSADQQRNANPLPEHPTCEQP